MKDTVTVTVTPDVSGWAKVLTERWIAHKKNKRLYMREYRKRKSAEKKK